MVNRNLHTAAIFVDELARAGLRHICFAPGSRNTPLIFAFARHDDFRIWSHLDERSAAFFALGLATALDEPVALLCTSGTAAANYMPAIVEAHQSRIPLLVLTADRPPELRHSGANQTIDQIKLYGDYALWFVDAPLPEPATLPVVLRHWRTLAGRAIAIANGSRKGVVHINLPFRKPLEPTPDEHDHLVVPPAAQSRIGQMPYAHIPSAHLQVPADDLAGFVNMIATAGDGWLLCGPRAARNPGNVEAIQRISQATGYPIVADAASGLRWSGSAAVAGAFDHYLGALPADFPHPDVILRIGDVPTSPVIARYLDATSASILHLAPDGVWADDLHRVAHLIAAPLADVAQALEDRMLSRPQPSDHPLIALDKHAWQALATSIGDHSHDGAFVRDLLATIPDGATLFAGNSLPIRHLDQLAQPDSRHVRIIANRGASGIDGNLSTALGAGAGQPSSPLFALVGDITFYHDMNGLLAVQRCGVPITIILLNNDGGGIFHRLPVQAFEPEFTQYFLTPHGLDFSHAARLYGLDYVCVEDRQAFRTALTQPGLAGRSRIIEVRTNSADDEQTRQAVFGAVREQVRHFFTTTSG